MTSLAGICRIYILYLDTSHCCLVFYVFLKLKVRPTTKKAVKKINSNLEKTTLGDISELAALKDKLEKGE